MSRSTTIVIVVLLLSLYISIASAVAPAKADVDVYLYVFGSDDCPACRAFKEWLTKNYTGVWYFCELHIDECRNRFSYLNGLMGLPLAAIPTTVVVNGTVRAIVIGAVTDSSFWDYLMKMPTEGPIPIFRGEKMIAEISNPIAREAIMTDVLKVHTGGLSSPSGSEIDYYSVTVSLAALDSLNPCTFVLLATLLLIIILAGGVEGSIYGATFAVSTIVSFVLFGVSTFSFAALVPRTLMPAVAAAFGVLTTLDAIAEFIHGGFRDNAIVSRIRRASKSLVWPAILGFASPFTLLPCIAGPYVLFIRAINDLGVAGAVKYVLLYSAVFAMPTATLALLGLLALRTKKVAEWLRRYEKMVRFSGGVLLLLLSAVLIR